MADEAKAWSDTWIDALWFKAREQTYLASHNQDHLRRAFARAVAAAIKEAHEPSLWACRCGHAQFADPAEVSGGTCLSCGEVMDAYALVAAALEAGQ